jgi:hypothetical protein
VTVHDHISRTLRDLPHNLLLRQLAGDLRRRNVFSRPRARQPRHTRVPQRQRGQPPHGVMCKLQLIPEYTPISLALPSELRSSSAFRHVFRHPWSADILTRIVDRSEARRTAQQGRVARRLQAMADCLICAPWRAFPPTATRRLPNPHMHVCAVGPAPSAHVHSALRQRWGGGAERHRAACGRGASRRVRSARSRASRSIVRAADRQTVARGVQLRARRSS